MWEENIFVCLDFVCIYCRWSIAHSGNSLGKTHRGLFNSATAKNSSWIWRNNLCDQQLQLWPHAWPVNSYKSSGALIDQWWECEWEEGHSVTVRVEGRFPGHRKQTFKVALVETVLQGGRSWHLPPRSLCERHSASWLSYDEPRDQKENRCCVKLVSIAPHYNEFQGLCVLRGALMNADNPKTPASVKWEKIWLRASDWDWASSS